MILRKRLGRSYNAIHKADSSVRKNPNIRVRLVLSQLLF